MSVSVFDVAKYILEMSEEITTMKLQKLVYYAQAWNLVWEEEPLFPEKIKAWANGPVVPELYHAHKGRFVVRTIKKGSTRKLTETQKENIDKVLEFYGNLDGHFLSDLTHRELPWKNTRGDIPAGKNSSREITLAVMAEYYGGL